MTRGEQMTPRRTPRPHPGPRDIRPELTVIGQMAFGLTICVTDLNSASLPRFFEQGLIAMVAMSKLARVARANWGTSSEGLHTIYRRAFESMARYSVVYNAVLQLLHNCARLNHVVLKPRRKGGALYYVYVRLLCRRKPLADPT